MNRIWAFLVMCALISMSFFIGISVAPETPEEQTSGNVANRDVVSISGTRVFSSSTEFVERIAVYKNKVAWEGWHTNSSGAYTSEIYVSIDGGAGTVISASDGLDMYPDVGDTVVWIHYPDDGTPSYVDSINGVICKSNSNIYKVAINGDTVAFLKSNPESYKGTFGYMKLGSAPKYVDIDYNPTNIDVSGQLILFGHHLYSMVNNTYWTYTLDNFTYSKISGDWIVETYRSNFGKDVVIAVKNLKTGYLKVIWDKYVGYYESIDSIDIDTNYVVWSFDGTAYIYNIPQDKVSTLSIQNVMEIAIGGGTIAWTTNNNSVYEVWYANAPSIGTYVDVIMKDRATGIDVGYHNLLITDKNGNKLGCDKSGNYYHDIPNSVAVLEYGRVKEYRIFTSDPSSLTYEVFGAHNGYYDLYVIKYYEGRSRAIEFSYDFVNATDIPISAGEIDSYNIDWIKLEQKEDGAVILKIDSNGDGTFDKEVTASTGDITPSIKNSATDVNSGILSIALGGFLCLLIIGVIVFVIVLLVVAVVRKK